MIKKFIHINLAILVFLSSSGLWVNSHFCQHEFLKSSFYFSFGSCCDAIESSSCSENHDTCDMGDSEEGEDGCCENRVDFYKLDQDQQLQLVEFKPFNFLISSPAIIPEATIPFVDQLTLHFQNYSPPLIVYDRLKRFETFLC
jgi:hypothetical protein